MRIILICFLSLFFTSSFIAAKKIPEEKTSSNLIDVGTPTTKKIRIAVPLFHSSPANAVNSKNRLSGTTRFKEMLNFTNWFYFIPNNIFESKLSTNFSFVDSDWKIIQADYVIFGTFIPTPTKNEFTFEIYAVNVSTQATIAKKSYENLKLSNDLKLLSAWPAGSPELDLALRDFGDIFIKAITGTLGPFMTQITFVGRSSLKAHTSNIYVADFDGGHPYSITKNNTINLSPAWSPKGESITYTSFQTGKAEIFEYNLYSKTTKQLTFENTNSSGSNWHPDGDLLVFSSATSEGATHLYSMEKGSRVKEPLITVSNIVVEPAFSPNGIYLAYTSNKFQRPMIFLYNLETNETTRLTYTGWYNASATWSPDSERLAFASFDKNIDRWDLFKINVDRSDLDDSDLERLTLKEGDNEKPSWSPEGRFILFQSNRGEAPNINTIKGNRYKLYVISENGTNQRPLHISVPDCRQPAWGPRMVLEE